MGEKDSVIEREVGRDREDMAPGDRNLLLPLPTWWDEGDHLGAIL